MYAGLCEVGDITKMGVGFNNIYNINVYFRFRRNDFGNKEIW